MHIRAIRLPRAASAPALLVGCCVLAVAGCGSSGAASEGDGDQLVVDTSFVVQSLDPAGGHGPTQSIADKAIYDTLLTEGPDKEVVPSLATSFAQSPDGKTYTFKLRHDVKFADGTPLTSADVVFSINRLNNLGKLVLLPGVTPSAPDAHTVVLKSETPNPAIPKILTMPSLGIVNSKLVKANGGTDGPDAAKSDSSAGFFNKQSAGSGPYQLKSYAANSRITLEANPNYWGRKPRFKTVVIRNMPAPTQQLNVQRGSNEIALDLSNQQASKLKGDPHLQVHIGPSPNIFFIGLNMNPKLSPTSANPHIQEAVRYGIDYSALLQIAGPGAVRTAGLVPSMIMGAAPASDAVQTNVERAKAAVAASGIEHPAMTLAFPNDLTINGVEFPTLAQRLQADLGAIGISLKLEAIPTTTFLKKVATGKIQMMGVYTTINFPDPSDTLKFLPGGPRGADVSWKRGMDPGLDELIARAAAALDADTRAQLFEELQQRLVKTGPWVTLFQSAQAIVGSSNLTNLELNPTWTVDVAAVGTK